ncbi:MAG: hypothetical protein LBN71_03425 [Tannerella sp.]|jgi:hypothetical protein|nr:hypothetical protein [Tannerella sp.]
MNINSVYQLKSVSVWFLGILLLAGCGGKTKKAREHLEAARMLYENQQYAATKNAIDTIRLLYPREVEVLRESLALMRLTERSECERNIAYCDSMTPIRLEEVESLKKGFVFEKDSNYEDLGNYIWKQQVVERNVERSYIRCGVDEKGELYLSSVYFGGRPLNHTGLKLSAPNGTYAETATVPYDGGMNYRFKDEGNTTEAVTYKGEKCIEAVNLVYGADDKTRIKAEYTGGTAYSIYLTENDKKAIRATCDLAVVLNDIEAMRIEKERATKRILYLNSKMEGQ